MSVLTTLIECAAIVALLSAAAPAQTPPAFEVTVIKPSLPMADALPRDRRVRRE
jgi:hypothetical protein